MIRIVFLLIAQGLGSPAVAGGGLPAEEALLEHSELPTAAGLAESGAHVPQAEATAQEDAHRRQAVRRIRVQMAFTGLALAFGLLHLILFLFLPRLRSHLFFSLFLLLYAVALFFDFQNLITGSEPAVRVHRAALSLSLVFLLRFFYELFLPKPPRQFYWIVAGLLAAGLLATVEPRANFKYLILMSGVHWVEVLRVEVQAIRRKQDGAWIIVAGFGALFLFGLYDLLIDVGLMEAFHGIENGYQFGLLGLFIATSVYLARDIARTNEKLIVQQRRVQEQEMERRLLEAEMARKTKELEEARALQLSMLPAALPALPTLDIAVHMQTAAEVGGDYYDFHLAPDDTLTVAVGDATGHGLKAGMMVAIAKSLFKGAVMEPDIRRFFERCTRILKQMHLGNLFMGLTLLRLRQGRLVASAAGMPPMLIYRAHNGEIEVVTLKGMPLGAFHGFRYQQHETELAPGDAVLLMTDGFPELFNGRREMLGYSRAQAFYQEAADRPAEAIIAHLREAQSIWTGNQPPEDDVTFVVLKLRNGSRPANSPER